MSGPALQVLLAEVAAGGQLGLGLADAAWAEHGRDTATFVRREWFRQDALLDAENNGWTDALDETQVRAEAALRLAGHATASAHETVICAASAATIVDLGHRTGLTIDHVTTLSRPWLHAAAVRALLAAAGPDAEAVAATLLADRWWAPLDTLPGTVQALLAP